MSKSHANGHRSTDHKTTAAATRHSKDDALEDREFQLLLEGCHELDDYYALEARFVVLCAGRLGLRVGEIIHMQESWIDWRRRMIQIPAREACRKGQDGGVCGYCRQLSKQEARHNEGLSVEQAIRDRWTPKTDAAVRSIPFDFDPRVEITVERYFDRFDEFQGSHSAVHRRLDRAVEQVDELEGQRIYPHCLRATAGSYHSSRGLNALTLQSLMGWADLSTAHRYVRRSGDRTRRALNAVHSR